MLAINLIKFAPATKDFTKQLSDAAQRFGITTKLEEWHWLAQLAHESGGFERLTENLNYRAEVLHSQWPSRFTVAESIKYAHKPEKIANRAYADRLGNGNEASGDGWLYRGRGFIQITGKENYTIFSHDVFGDDRLVKNPELAAHPDTAALIAGAYWRRKQLDVYANRDDIETITKKINGRLTGLASRKVWLKRAKEMI